MEGKRRNFQQLQGAGFIECCIKSLFLNVLDIGSTLSVPPNDLLLSSLKPEMDFHHKVITRSGRTLEGGVSIGGSLLFAVWRGRSAHKPRKGSASEPEKDFLVLRHSPLSLFN